MCASVAFDVSPENDRVHENVLLVGFSVPVNVPVAVVVTAVGFSFAPASVAVYVMLLFVGFVDLSLPQATTSPTPSIAVANVNACFCIWNAPSSEWAVRNREAVERQRPCCCSGYRTYPDFRRTVPAVIM